MATVKAFKPEVVALGKTVGLDERWLQDQIAADPSILGLGDLELKDRERIQPGPAASICSFRTLKQIDVTK